MRGEKFHKKDLIESYDSVESLSSATPSGVACSIEATDKQGNSLEQQTSVGQEKEDEIRSLKSLLGVLDFKNFVGSV